MAANWPIDQRIDRLDFQAMKKRKKKVLVDEFQLHPVIQYEHAEINYLTINQLKPTNRTEKKRDRSISQD